MNIRRRLSRLFVGGQIPLIELAVDDHFAGRGQDLHVEVLGLGGPGGRKGGQGENECDCGQCLAVLLLLPCSFVCAG